MNIGTFVLARRSFCSLVVAAGCLWASASIAAQPNWHGTVRAIGNQGEIYHLKTGTYEQLLPGTQGVNPQHRILVLEVQDADGVTSHLVPGTEGWNPERYPMLTYDSRSQSLMLFWTAAGYGEGRSIILLASYRDGLWSETFAVESAGSPVFLKDMPRVALTTDDFFLDLGQDVEPFEVRRTTFHVVWNNEDGIVRYAPVSFFDGDPAGWTETIPLSVSRLKSSEQGGPAGDEVPPTDLPIGLANTLSVDRATASNAVALTLTDASDGTLVTLRIEEMPLTLAHVASRVKEHLQELVDSGDGEITNLSEGIRAEIIAIGARVGMHPAVGEYVGNEVASWIQTFGADYGSDIETMSEDAWRHTMDVGSTLVRQQADDSELDPHTLDLSTLDIPDTHLHQLNELIRVRMRGSFSAPEGVGENPADIFASDDGRSLLVSWLDEENQVVTYVEDHGLGWSAPQTLALGEAMSLDQARTLLQQKIQ